MLTRKAKMDNVLINLQKKKALQIIHLTSGGQKELQTCVLHIRQDLQGGDVQFSFFFKKGGEQVCKMYTHLSRV